MGTHDEETSQYFKNTRVKCVLFPREASHAQESVVRKNTADRIFTHHQKTVPLHPDCNYVARLSRDP